jgi:50S ribosomal subunit-associated GTPase HflX
LPCLLVENKVDLLEERDFEDPDLPEFAQQNEFCGSFRTSAKIGYHISEAMEFLIKTIIKRMEDMQSKGNEVFTTDRKNVALDPEKHNQAASKRKKDKDGCC